MLHLRPVPRRLAQERRRGARAVRLALAVLAAFGLHVFSSGEAQPAVRSTCRSVHAPEAMGTAQGETWEVQTSSCQPAEAPRP